MNRLPVFSRIAAAVCALAAAQFVPGSAAAEDLAILVGNFHYQTQPQVDGQNAMRSFNQAIGQAGFNPVYLEDSQEQRLVSRMAQLVGRMNAADRLIVLVQGHVVRTGWDSWLLATDAGVPNQFTVGQSGIPLGPILSLAAQHAGSAVVAVADHNKPATLGSGMVDGYLPRGIPQGVTVLTGPVTALTDFIAAGVSDPGTPISDRLKGQSDVRGYGFLPRMGSFAALPTATSPSYLPSPEDRAMAAEAALQLTIADKRRIQQSLALLGYDPKGIDGVFGPATRSAISAWQGAQGVAATGYLTSTQVKTLFAQADARAAKLKAEAQQRQAAEDAKDTAYWRDTGRGATEAGARAYLEKYPDGLFSDIARADIARFEKARLDTVSPRERQAWNNAMAVDTSAAYAAYLAAYPHGAFADEAKARYADRKKAESQSKQIEQYRATEMQVAGNLGTRIFVESRLNDLGLNPGKVDGIFDQDTRRALRRFQQTRGLQVTGYVDQPTTVRLVFGG